LEDESKLYVKDLIKTSIHTFVAELTANWLLKCVTQCEEERK